MRVLVDDDGERTIFMIVLCINSSQNNLVDTYLYFISNLGANYFVYIGALRWVEAVRVVNSNVIATICNVVTDTDWAFAENL